MIEAAGVCGGCSRTRFGNPSHVNPFFYHKLPKECFEVAASLGGNFLARGRVLRRFWGTSIEKCRHSIYSDFFQP